MRSVCDRTGCDRPAAAGLALEHRRRLVWMGDLEPGTWAPMVLCADHANALRVPQGWTLRDVRDPQPTLWPATTARPATRPKPSPRVLPAPPRRVRTLPTAATAQARRQDIAGMLDAHTPLLARAFRGAHAS